MQLKEGGVRLENNGQILKACPSQGRREEILFFGGKSIDDSPETLDLSRSQWEDMKELWHTAVPSRGLNFITP